MGMKQSSSSYNLDISGEVAELFIKVALRAEHVNELKVPLMKALASAKSVRVKAGDLMGMALPVLQMLCSACQTATLMDKRLTIEGEHLEEFIKAAEGIGFSRDAMCDFQESPSGGKSSVVVAGDE